MGPEKDGRTGDGIQPDPAAEREVPAYFDEFTLSGGCCSSGLEEE
ncbi:MAG TPA: hypothetical protein VHE12_04260 [bacterium]|nr:hypothetical protein [bacterium]